MNAFLGGRSLRVQTQPYPLRLPPAKKTVATVTSTTNKGFMKSTLSSSRKGSPRRGESPTNDFNSNNNRAESPANSSTSRRGNSPVKARRGSPVNIPFARRGSPVTVTSVRNMSHMNIPPEAQIERDDKEEKLMNNVLKFTRSSDRRMLLRTLKDCSFLQHIPVDDKNTRVFVPRTDCEWKELEQEIAYSIPFELNGVVFGADVEEKNKKYEGDKLLQLLKLLCNKLTQTLTKTLDNNFTKLSSDELYRSLLVRLSSSNGSSTGFSLVNTLIGSKELMIQVPKKPIRPVQIPVLIVYSSDNAIHIVSDQSQTYGLFRKSDAAGKPWIGLTTVFHERTNLTTGSSVRCVDVQIHEEKFTSY